jgi:cytoskeletal protein RodZ
MPSFEEKVTLSFGRYLQAIRLEKAISLEVVSKETRIRKDMLALIEEENHNKLPNEVFVKGFIRAYAEAIGADGSEAVFSNHLLPADRRSLKKNRWRSNPIQLRLFRVLSHPL